MSVIETEMLSSSAQGSIIEASSMKLLD